MENKKNSNEVKQSDISSEIYGNCFNCKYNYSEFIRSHNLMRYTCTKHSKTIYNVFKQGCCLWEHSN